jgi:hypothetical protein
MTNRYQVLKLTVTVSVLLFLFGSVESLAQTGVVFVGPDSLNSTSVPYFINSDGTGRYQIPGLVGVGQPKWSRDGSLFVAQGTAIGGSNPDIFTFNRAGDNLRNITALNIPGYSVEALFPAFSPDAKKIAVTAWLLRTSDSAQCVIGLLYSSSGTLLAELAGGCELPGNGNGNAGFGIDWSPTASLIASPVPIVVQCSATLFLPVTPIAVSQPVAGASGIQITHPDACVDPLTQVYDVWPVFSPDGTKIAYLRWFISGTTASTAVRVVNLDGTNDHEVAFFSGEQELGISWSAGGTQLLFDRTQLIGGVPIAGSFGLWKINTDGTGLTHFVTPVAFSPSWAFRNPKPMLSSLSPASVRAGSHQFTLIVSGSNFAKGAVVRWKGLTRATAFVSSKQLKAIILANDVAVAGIATVTAVNPGPGGGSSNGVTFTVQP